MLHVHDAPAFHREAPVHHVHPGQIQRARARLGQAARTGAGQACGDGPGDPGVDRDLRLGRSEGQRPGRAAGLDGAGRRKENGSAGIGQGDQGTRVAVIDGEISARHDQRVDRHRGRRRGVAGEARVLGSSDRVHLELIHRIQRTQTGATGQPDTLISHERIGHPGRSAEPGGRFTQQEGNDLQVLNNASASVDRIARTHEAG